MADLRILYVNHCMHVSQATGMHLRILNIGRLLRRLGSVKMVSIGPRQNAETAASFEQAFGAVTWLKPVYERNPEGPLMKRYLKLRYHWPWWHTWRVAQADQRRFELWRQEHDLVWFHSLDAADALTGAAVDRSVMDLDDLHHVKWRLRSDLQTRLRPKLGFKVLGWKWRVRETAAARRFKVVTVCSEQDRQILHGTANVEVLPNGFARPEQVPRWRERKQLRLGFIGALGYEPNMDGLIWFRDEVWPLILQRRPEARLRIIGRGPGDGQELRCAGFEPLGYVQDVTEEFDSWSALIVPLRIGSGTRVKILEAFSRKCPVVSTPIGAYGIEAEPGRELLVSGDAEEFAAACLALLADSARGAALAENGWQLFDEKYAWDCMAGRVDEIVAAATSG